MSAFLVSADHIDYILTGALRLGNWHAIPGGNHYLTWDLVPDTITFNGTTYPTTKRIVCDYETVDAIGQELLQECMESVSYRYPRDTVDELPGPIDKTAYQEPYIFQRVQQEITLPQLAKAISCYEYQSCEHPLWKESRARQFCQELREYICASIDGYEDAAWEWERP